jgi:hypothetical protein
VQTSLGDVPNKLFLMDSGAGTSIISLNAAHEVTQVSSFHSSTVEGISGKVQKVLSADKVDIVFAGGIHQALRSADSFDVGRISRFAGVDISGIIGFPALRQLVISVDYRDNLIHVVYDPKKGFHAPQQ